MKILSQRSLRNILFYSILFICLLTNHPDLIAASAPGASLPPIIDSPCEDITFCDFSDEDDQPGNADLSESCDGYAELILLAHDANSPGNVLDYSWHIYDPGDTVTPLYAGTGDNASDEYPYGTYLIKWLVEDLDGNISYCEYSFTINDCKLPTVVCNTDLAVELLAVDLDGNGSGDDCRVTISGSDFLNSRDDNCTPDSELKLRIQRQNNGVFDVVNNPEDLGTSVIFVHYDYEWYTPQGHHAPVRLWVGDNAGNWQYCETSVLLQINIVGPCELWYDPVGLSGTIMTEENEYVAHVNVTILNTENNQFFSLLTGNSGGFYSYLPYGWDYRITPYRNDDPLNGVTTWDIILITKHILNTFQLGSPYKMIAADINNSGAITANDLVELRKMILQINNNFPNNTSWRFIPQDYVFPDPANPWSTEFPEVVNISNFPALPYNANFVAVHTGDSNGSSAANPLSGNDDRNFIDALVLNTNAQNIKKGEAVSLAINAKDFDIQGYQFTLDFDKNALEYTGIIPGALPVSDDNIGVFDGALTTSWNGDVDLAGDATLFTLTFLAKADIELSKVVSINSRITPAEAYSKTGDLMDINLAFNNGDISSGNEFELYQNEPNPFNDVTTIGFNLPAGGQAKVTVYDAVGRVLHRIERQFAKGYNAVQIRREDLQTSGILFYELSDATESATKKLVVLE